MRKGLRENSIDIVERNSQGFGFALHLSLTAKLPWKRYCTQQNTGFKRLSANLGEVLW